MFFEPHLPIPRPSVILAVLGGATATLLLTALSYLAPLLGFPFIDYARLIGGVFTTQPDVALWLGYWIFFLFGTVIFPMLLVFVWPFFPGSPVGIVGPLLKGVLWGAILWILSGLVGWIFGGWNRLPGFSSPGFFMLRAGILASLGNLLGHVLYTLAMILITSMGRGIEPIDTLGVPDYHYAQSPDLVRGLPVHVDKQRGTAH